MFKQFLNLGLMSLVLPLCSSLVLAEANNNHYEELDRFESFNRAMFIFNDKADDYVLKPVAKAYNYVTPKFINEGISNVFSNLGDVSSFANSLLQAKFHNAMVSLNRVIYNTTFGLGGFFDVATFFGLKSSKEDFGQTLAVWGYENSSYLVLPFLGPSTMRDFTGKVVDLGFDPVRYYDGADDETVFIAKVIEVIDLRADLLGAENLLAGMDRYRFIRSAYYQNREYLIKNGEVEDPFTNESMEDYEDF